MLIDIINLQKILARKVCFDPENSNIGKIQLSRSIFTIKCEREQKTQIKLKQNFKKWLTILFQTKGQIMYV